MKKFEIHKFVIIFNSKNKNKIFCDNCVTTSLIKYYNLASKI